MLGSSGTPARVDRLSASEGWLSLVGLDFLPTASGQTLSFGGPDADLSPEGIPAKRMGQFVLGQEGWRFQAAKHEACTFDGKEADEGLLQTDADGRSTVQNQLPFKASGEGSWY